MHGDIETAIHYLGSIHHNLWVICLTRIDLPKSIQNLPKDNKAPVNVSRAYITILAGYVCVVRTGTALVQAFQGRSLGVRISFLTFLSVLFPPPYLPNTIWVEEDQ